MKEGGRSPRRSNFTGGTHSLPRLLDVFVGCSILTSTTTSPSKQNASMSTREARAPRQRVFRPLSLCLDGVKKKNNELEARVRFVSEILWPCHCGTPQGKNLLYVSVIELIDRGGHFVNRAEVRQCQEPVLPLSVVCACVFLWASAPTNVLQCF